MTNILFTPELPPCLGIIIWYLQVACMKYQQFRRVVLLQFLHGTGPTVPLINAFNFFQRPIADDQCLRKLFGMDYLVDNVFPN
jgi:hypothetical protein